MRFRGIAYCTIVVLTLVLVVSVLHQAAASSPRPTVNLNSSLPPVYPAYPPSADGHALEMLPYFDDYSWQMFASMVWPAASRGEPDLRRTVVSENKPKVFETLKAAWEVIHTDNTGKPDGSAPANWGVYDDPKYNACSHTMQFGDLVLASFSKFSDMGQAGAGYLDKKGCDGDCGPLMARNRTFLHYLTGYNHEVFDSTRAWLVNFPNLPQIGFRAGSTPGTSALTVKSAWMEMTRFTAAQKARYYIRNAWVLDPDAATCSQREVGLVGLHIVQRTLRRPQWIWSSFEQVDNVPPPDPLGSDGTFAFHEPGAPVLGATNPYPQIPISTPTAPLRFYNAVRRLPIHPSTRETNLAYRKELRKKGSVWQYYQLVMTQFPIKSVVGSDGANPANWFPGAGNDGTAFSNITMETFHQSKVDEHSCLGCHSLTRTQSDFVWSVFDRAWGHVPGIAVQNTLNTRLLAPGQ